MSAISTTLLRSRVEVSLEFTYIPPLKLPRDCSIGTSINTGNYIGNMEMAPLLSNRENNHSSANQTGCLD